MVRVAKVLTATIILLMVALAGCAEKGLPAAEAQWLGDFNQLTQVVPSPIGRDLIIVEREGRIWKWSESTGDRVELLDLTDTVATGGERGLTSIAFHPDFASNGAAYITYSKSVGEQDPSIRSTPGESHLALVKAENGDLNEGLQFIGTIISVDVGRHFHNIGLAKFGPDGMLYVAMGDGGANSRAAQELDSLRGSIWRIDVDTGSPGYSIPDSNPFVDQDDARGEIWLYGFRNVWRFDFDDQGNMFMSETGDESREEVSWFPSDGEASRNFGWPLYEGTLRTEYGGDPDEANLNWPIVEYDHDSGCAVVGGAVYRGETFASVRGSFIVADHCFANGMVVDQHEGEWRLRDWFTIPGDRVNSIDLDHEGELLVSGFSGRLYRIVS